MSMNISGSGNTYNGINTNSKQYKALKEKGWLSGVIQNESMMSPEEKMIYETFGGRDTIIKNLMKQFDSDGDLLNANGVAGMDVTGKGTSWQKLTSVSEEYRQKMFDNVKKEFIQENGISNGDTTKRSDIFKDYQLSVSTAKDYRGDSWSGVNNQSEFYARSQNSFYKKTSNKKDRQKELLEEYLEKRAQVKKQQQEMLNEKIAKQEQERSRLLRSWNNERLLSKASNAYEARYQTAVVKGR